MQSFLSEVDEKSAARKLREIVKLKPSPQELARAIKLDPPAIPQGRFLFKVPHRGRYLEAEVLVPEGHSHGVAALPVVVNLLLGRIPDTVEVPGAINVWLKKYNPERLSDDGRDGFLKVAQAVAWRANGDPSRLWLTGFSWAGHATFDIAMHRPGVLRGIIPMAGAPRRSDFRLLRNLRGMGVFAMCGAKDDRELLWNLKELKRRAKANRFDYELGIDPNVPGRLIPAARYVPQIAPFIEKQSPRKAPQRGLLVIDQPSLRLPWLRPIRIDKRRVKIATRIPVSAKLSRDEQRRQTIDAMIDKVVTLSWRWENTNKATVLNLESGGVKEVSVLVHESMLTPGTKLSIQGGRPKLRPFELKPSLESMLKNARSTGNRHDLVLKELKIRF